MYSCISRHRGRTNSRRSQMFEGSPLEYYIKKFSEYDPVISAHVIETMDVEESGEVFI